MKWIEKQAEGMFKDWDTNGLDHPNVKFLMEWVERKGKNLAILDVGCGNAEVADMLHEKGHEVIGLDLPEVVAKIRHDKLYGRYYGLDLNQEHFPFPDDKYDIIYCASVIEHLWNDSFLLTNIREHLKDDGVAIITIPSKINISENHCRFYPPIEWMRLVEAYGFDVFEVKDFHGPSMKDHLDKEGELWCKRCLSRNMWALRRTK